MKRRDMRTDHHSAYLSPILEKYGENASNLMQILREAQECHGYLHPDAIDFLCEKLGLPRTKIVGVASFYSFFYLEPRGQYRILFSDNITDRMMGSELLLARMCKTLWLEKGKLSEDALVSVDTTSCTGMCDQGPALLVNNFAITHLTEARVDSICALVREQVPLEEWPSELFEVKDNIRRSDILLLEEDFSLRAALRQGPEAILSELKLSNLRGRGGAGFATALKWEACRNAAGSERYVICNADEGEPGTFKDRVLLTLHAKKVFEGMILCGFVIGSKKGMLYLRGEYRYLLGHLEKTLQDMRQAHLLGNAILGDFDFDIEIHMGAGAYICGEESALIESLEGKRGTPRNRPPFPVTNGYLDRPTVVNNVETFCAATLVAAHGGKWYSEIGTQKSSGTKILSVSGDCERPGIYEYPFGVTVREVLQDCRAISPQAVQVSGPSGVMVAQAEFDRKIAFEDIPTAGAFMVFGKERDMFEVARNFVHFFAHESCGFCTPCRVGTALLRNLMDKLHNGHGSAYDFEEIRKLNGILQSMSHCGLGHSACNPVLDSIAKFRPAYEKRMLHHEFTPAFDLDQALQAARQMTGRDDRAAHLAKGEQ
ncbi:MAG: NAD(P)H-dependent oxidoreductase subunit E [Burkholderiales bacterium]|nr:NAD(P)H-dependent oxidoreductase subunit E [Burkholderiales bacterium]